MSKQLDFSKLFEPTPYQKYTALIKSNGSHNALMADSNNCTVLALAACFGISYDEAYNKAEKIWNRRHAKGVRSGALLNWFANVVNNGIKIYNKTVSQEDYINVYKNGDKTVLCKSRIGTFAKNHPHGTYYVLVRGHATVVKDGKIMDFTKPGCYVVKAWKIS